MPLIVSDWSWSQVESIVYINVPLRGVTAGKVDIMLTEQYLKVHYPPYLFEVFLFEPVDDVRSTARVGNGTVFFSLPKKTSRLWEQLMITADNEEKKEMRERALLKYQEKLSSLSRSKAEKNRAESKYALETMMKLEKEERDRIERMKETERQKTAAELTAWQLKQKEEDQNKLKEMVNNQENRQIITLDRRRNSEVKRKESQVEIPDPRPTGDIQVTFTPRVFPTALRESRVAEEEEWLKKQAEARRAANADIVELKELKESQRNADWLKDKGDKCFVRGDYLGAVNAYTLAIKLNCEIPALYSNRAACHLKLHNLHKAIEDSSQALDLLTPHVDTNAAARARAHVRRGSAFCQLQLYAEGLQDYQAALKIEPHNEALQADTQIIRHYSTVCRHS